MGCLKYKIVLGQLESDDFELEHRHGDRYKRLSCLAVGTVRTNSDLANGQRLLLPAASHACRVLAEEEA